MKYNIGLLGCGNMGRVWSGVVPQNPDCSMRYTFDLNPDLARERAEETGAEPVNDPDRIFESPDVNVVIIATPTFTHPDLVARAAKAGKHILCEKPMALTQALCQQMLDACEESGVKLAIG
ncbi:MAG: Gfo/Idh/MocA family oxidoreductase, partial [bacterium]|nr:Gfo/Idh/MocA family oxidoreductase [bacterium]